MADIKGWAELQAKLQALKNVDFSSSLEKGAWFGLGKSQEVCPVDTGFLRSSGDVVVTGENQVAIVYTADYSYYVERRESYLRKPLDENEKEISEIVAKDIAEQIGRQI